MAEARVPANRLGSVFGNILSRLRRRIDPAIAWAFACIVVVLLVGSLYSSSFLSPEYLLQQLKVASFLGVIATGMMIVILLGQIDLSVPWVVAVGGMMATAATGWGPLGEASAANGGAYTLYSIAAVVLGGVSLFGGSGSAIGAIFGALMFRTIGDLLFVFNVEPLWQPLFQGMVLLAAVCLGSARLLRIRNQLDLYG